MKTIEEIAFTINGQKCTFKVLKYEEEVTKSIRTTVNVGEISMHMGYKYINKKIKVTKYKLIQLHDNNREINETLICETETYATVLTILKGILSQYVELINKLQNPSI